MVVKVPLALKSCKRPQSLLVSQHNMIAMTHVTIIIVVVCDSLL